MGRHKSLKVAEHCKEFELVQLKLLMRLSSARPELRIESGFLTDDCQCQLKMVPEECRTLEFWLEF